MKLRPDSLTASGATSLPEPPTPAGWPRRLGSLLLLALLVALSAGAGRWLHHLAPLPPGMLPRGPIPLLGVLGLLLLAWLLAVGLHELGHVLVGRWQHFRFQWLVVGPFRWQQRAGRVRFGWNTAWSAAGGLVLSVPTDEVNLRRRFLAYAAGGPLASVVWAALALGGYALLPVAVRAHPLALVLGLSGAVSAVLAILTLLPLRWGSFASDGARMRTHWRGGPASALETAVLVAGGRLLVGTRPRDLPQQALEQAVGLPDDLPFKPYVYHYLYLAALDGGHVARAGQYLAAYRLRLPQLPAAYHAVVWLESAFFAAAYAQDLPAARAFRARAAPSALTPADVTARTEAALARVAGDAAQAQRQAERALRHLPDNPDQGGSCFYAEWLHQTLQWAAAHGQAP